MFGFRTFLIYGPRGHLERLPEIRKIDALIHYAFLPSRIASLFTPGTRQNALHGLLFPERYKVSSRLEKNDSRAVLAGRLSPREAVNVVAPPLGQFYPFFPISGAVIYPSDRVSILVG